MLVDLKRKVAYIYPACSSMSTKYITVFSFSGADKVSLICPTHGCHEKCVSITGKNSKYTIRIECPLCGATHTYAVTRESFWNKKLLSFQCSAAGIDVFFAGDKQSVQQAIEDSADAYSDAFTDEFGDFGAYSDNLWDSAEDYNLLYEITDRLVLLKNSHNLSCMCGSDEIDFSVRSGAITLTCLRCGRQKEIPVSEDTLTRLLNTGRIIISD